MGPLLKAYDQLGHNVPSGQYIITKQMNVLEFKEGDDYWDFEMTTESAMAVSGLHGALREPYPVKPKFGSKLWSVFVFEATAYLAAQEPVTPVASGHDAMGR
jgi:hypothetical protein